MSEDLTSIKNLNIDYQFQLFGKRILIKDIGGKNPIVKAIIKRIVQFKGVGMLSGDKSIPIVINNFNRLSFLEKQIESLQRRGYKNLYVIDNNSSYGPLIEFYKNAKIKVFYFNQNVGFLSIWKSLVYEYFKDNYYVYTDSDIIPDRQCPDDFISHFKMLLDKYPQYDKAGFGLKIVDIPDCYQLKEKVQLHEQQFWTNKLDEGVYEAMIDTTFALYKPRKKGGYWLRAIRTGGEYIALHLPWYNDSENLSEEDIYYNKNIKTSTHWTALLNDENQKARS